MNFRFGFYATVFLSSKFFSWYYTNYRHYVWCYIRSLLLCSWILYFGVCIYCEIHNVNMTNIFPLLSDSIFFKCERTKYDKENDSKRIDWNSPGIFVIACDQSGCWEQFHCQCDQGNSDEKWHWNRFGFHISFCNNNMTSVEFFPFSKLEKSICTDSKWTGIVSVFQSHAMQTTIKKIDVRYICAAISYLM